MYRSFPWVAPIILLLTASGCSICCNEWDDAYPAYGGAWERHDRFHGRVGSVFDPAGAPVMQGPAVGEPYPGEPYPGEAYETLPPGPVETDDSDTPDPDPDPMPRPEPDPRGGLETSIYP